MKLSIIIPVYNEEEIIEGTLCELEMYMNKYTQCSSWEIIAVNDGSSDSTLVRLNNLKITRPWLKVIDLVKNFGRGKALRAGFEQSTGDIIISLDADLSYAPYHIERMVNKLIAEAADIVVASAYHKKGSVKNVPAKRLMISKIGNKILSYMFGSNVNVLTCMVRAYNQGFIKSLDLHSNDKEIHLEILSKAKTLGAKIVEIPADLHWRQTKLKKGIDKNFRKRRSTIKIKSTSSSHLFFALLSKPGIIFRLPGFTLISSSSFIFLVILYTIINDLNAGTSIYHAIRNSMVRGAISWLTMTFSFLLGIQFLTLGFLTNQSKSNQEENYRTLHTIFTEIKKLKKD